MNNITLKQLELLQKLYKKYIFEIDNMNDINRWSQKKTITKKILQCKGHEKLSKEEKKAKGIRKNETDVWDAIKNEEDLQEGNKVWVYPISKTIIETGRISEKTGKPLKDMEYQINSLKLIKNWQNDHDRAKLKERIYATLCILKTILDPKEIIK